MTSPFIIHHNSCAHLLVSNAPPIKPFSFDVPSNLLLFTSRDSSPRKSLFKAQMEMHGCLNYKEIFVEFSDKEKLALKAPNEGTPYGGDRWSNTFRLRYHLDYLKSKECLDKDYVLFVDADDVLFLESPARALDIYLNDFSDRYDLVYNATGWRGGSYWHESKKSLRADRLSRENQNGLYINAGACVGKKDLLIEVYEKTLEYVIDDLNLIEELRKERSPHCGQDHFPVAEGPRFPLGARCDQIILRYIQWDFPRLRVDFENKIFYRGSVKRLIDSGKINKDEYFL